MVAITKADGSLAMCDIHPEFPATSFWTEYMTSASPSTLAGETDLSYGAVTKYRCDVCGPLFRLEPNI